MAMTKKIGILQFPGTNCEYDCFHICKDILGCDTTILWHNERIDSLSKYDLLIVPGGFLYGDYLRAGAMALLSPVADDLLEFAESGRNIMGICNGFQVLCELGLLDGALINNMRLRYICRDVHVRVESNESPFFSAIPKGDVLTMPISHNQGCYYCDEDTLTRLEGQNSVVLRYCDENGNLTEESNPNGSVSNIAGIVNAQGNVFGLMPHPDRASESVLGSAAGLKIFQSAAA